MQKEENTGVLKIARFHCQDEANKNREQGIEHDQTPTQYEKPELTRLRYFSSMLHIKLLPTPAAGGNHGQETNSTLTGQIRLAHQMPLSGLDVITRQKVPDREKQKNRHAI